MGVSGVLVAMEMRLIEHSEPSHIHVPRPSRTARGPVQMQCACPASIGTGARTEDDDRMSAVDTD
jgi:hypothetical protein